jgi:hypothetical protein
MAKTYSNTVTINVRPSATAARKPDSVVASVNPADTVTPRTTQPANEMVKATAPADADFRDETPTALTGNRIALVIGNSTYKNVPALANPTRDADTMAASFRSAGFKTVQLRNDLTREKLTDALQDFAAEADNADWAVVYLPATALK